MMTNMGIVNIDVDGKRIGCPICNNDIYLLSRILLNTVGMTVFGLDWANKEAYAFRCRDCGNIIWFHSDAVEGPEYYEEKIPSRKKINIHTIKI